jgi:hypothetical protein
MVTKRPYNWYTGLISGAFCTICRARPVGRGLGAKIGRKSRGLAGPEVVEFGVRKYHWKRWGASHSTFSSGFCSKRGPFRPQHRRFPARPDPGDEDKFWSSHKVCRGARATLTADRPEIHKLLCSPRAVLPRADLDSIPWMSPFWSQPWPQTL